MSTRKTAGELSSQAMADMTRYDALEVGHYLAEDIEEHLYESIRLHKTIIDEPEFCVVMVIATDPLIPNLMRRKFYCWPYLPKPRPNQAVFLYNRAADRITKRLWVLPSDMTMAELATSNLIVHKRYRTMQAWCAAFFKQDFWEYIRYDQEIDMLSEHEYFLKHRNELIQSGCKIPDIGFAEGFDFDKIQIDHIVDTTTAMGE